MKKFSTHDNDSSKNPGKRKNTKDGQPIQQNGLSFLTSPVNWTLTTSHFKQEIQHKTRKDAIDVDQNLTFIYRQKVKIKANIATASLSQLPATDRDIQDGTCGK